MNGSLTPELVKDRLAELERVAQRSRSRAPRRPAPVRRSLGHLLVVLGRKLEGGTGVVTGEGATHEVAGVVLR